MGLENGKVAVTTVWVAGGTTEVVIPSSVTITWDGTADAEASGIFEVEQVGNGSPISVLDGETDVFNSITSVSIDEGPTKVASSAFWGASALKYLTLPASITEIGAYAFEQCLSLEAIYYNPTVAITVGDRAFNGTAEQGWNHIIENCKIYVINNIVKDALDAAGWPLADFEKKYHLVGVYDDNYTDLSWHNTHYVDVSFNRTFTAGQWHTLCVPFSIDAWNLKNVFGDGVEVAYLSGSSLAGNDLTLNFQTLDLTGDDYARACAPYLVKPSKDVDAGATFWSVYFDNSQSKINETTNAKFIGSFETKNLTANQYFMGNNNNLYTHAGVEMKGYRAYFEFNGSVPANVRARVVMQPRQTTAIGNVQESEPSTKVIENGQLYILKNGVRYNAQGQIVK